jgi:hypothetical protein
MIRKIAAAERIEVKTCRMRKHYDLPAISLIGYGCYGAEGRKMVEERFSTEKMCDRMHALYTSLLNGRGR